MKLGKSETLGIFYDHHGGVRHIDSDFNHRGRDKNTGGSTYKLLHLVIFFSRFHLTVYHTDLDIGKKTSHSLKSLLHALQ